MTYTQHYDSPLGGILLASDGTGLTGSWFDGEKYFADKEKEYKEQLGSDGETAQTWDEAREELVDQLIAEQDVKTV